MIMLNWSDESGHPGCMCVSGGKGRHAPTSGGEVA